MAATVETRPAPASTDIASLLAPEDIPVKLRCAVCSKLAVNAVKLPCCDQSICETCHSRLPASCPVCEHTPISAEDCKPNKNLRTTIRVYLRTEEKKREIAKGNTQNGKHPQSTSLSATDQQQPGRAPSHGTAQPVETGEKVETHVSESSGSKEKEKENETEKIERDLQSIQTVEPQSDRKEPAAGHNDTSIQNGVSGDPQNQVSSGADGAVALVGEQSLEAGVADSKGKEMNGVTDVGQPPSFSGGTLGADTVQASFPSMSWNAQTGFNPMIQNIQNPMANSQWNMFPNMMGMPAMSMNPMSTPQTMFGGLDGRGGLGMSGMNGMNMNMNMGMGMGMGMGPDAGGHGGYGGWNGQTGWTAGQEKFSPMGGAGNNMGGNFGAGSAGYGGYHHPANATAAAGYNFQSTNGNYSQMPQNQLYPQNHNFQTGFHGGVGHGYPPRGPRTGWNNRQFSPQNAFPGGRGYGQGYTGDKEPFHQQLPPQLQQIPVEPNQQMEQPGADRSDSGLDGSTEAKAVAGGDDMETASKGDDVDADPDHLREAKLSRDQESAEHANDATAAHEVGATMTTTRKSEENNDMMMNEQEGAIALAAQQVDKKDLESATTTALKTLQGPPTTDTKVINAPLGPAAHLARGRGLPRGVPRGPAGRGGRGGSAIWSNVQSIVPPAGPAAARTDFPGVVPVEPRGKGVEGAPTAPKAMRRGVPIPIIGRGGSSAAISGLVATTTKARSQSPDREKSRSRSRSPDHGHSHRSHSRRHGHRPRSSSDEDSERERRRERRSRHSRRDDHDRSEDKNREGRRKRSRERSVDRSISRSGSVSPTTKKTSNRTRREREHRDAENQRSSHRSRPERDPSRDRRQRPRRSRSPSSGRPVINDEGETRAQRRNSDIRVSSQLSPTSTRRRSSRDRLDKYRERDGQRHSRRERAESRSDSDRDRDRRNGRRNRHDERDTEKQREKDRARERDERRDSRAKATTAPTTAPDYHTLEREARNRERLLADQRKRERAADDDDDPGAGADQADNNNGGGQEPRNSKRRRHRHRGSSRRRASNVHGEVRPGGAEKLAAVLGGRKMSVKYEGDESDEARAARIEKEREAQRWE